MLRSFDIRAVVDVRSLPGSNKFPHFNQDVLEKSLNAEGITYVYLEDLGGRRKAKKDSHNTIWRNKSFQGYADYMETAAFQTALNELEEIGKAKPTAYMCAEAVWWRCHRSMVSDALKVKGWNVMHIMDVAKATEHPYTSPASVKDGKLIYGPEKNE